MYFVFLISRSVSRSEREDWVLLFHTDVSYVSWLNSSAILKLYFDFMFRNEDLLEPLIWARKIILEAKLPGAPSKDGWWSE